MRVLCINEEWRNDGVKYDFPTPVFGVEYYAFSCAYRKKETRADHANRIVATSQAGVYYSLRGFDKHEFHAINFAILPDATAEEMHEETRESIVNIETPVV